MCGITHAADPHSSHMPGQPDLLHVKANITVDFITGTMAVHERLIFNRTGPVRLDIRGQKIAKISNGARDLPFDLSEETKELGGFVEFDVPKEKVVNIYSITSPEALGLQWLTTVQAGSAHPMLYSQFESINGRSAFIAPDAPGVRFKHSVTLRVPEHLRGLVAAGKLQGTSVEHGIRTERWVMETPVPLYLISINVGDFVFRAFDGRCGVWADRQIIDQAHHALSRTPEVIATLEKLFGPYLWGTYNTLVLPALGYPFGAMEHPNLTSMNAMLTQNMYATTRVTIHEATHSWFGNLITNRYWGDFWLNEGVTTFGEWLAIREMLGEEAMLMQIASSIAELRKAIATFMEDGKPELTCLKVDLAGKNPDSAFSRVPYYKGALFLWAVMQLVGEDVMLAFLRRYIATYRFTSVDTEEFLDFMGQVLGADVLERVNAHAWVYEPGLPDNVPVITSAKTERIAAMAEGGLLPDAEVTGGGFQEWDLYLSNLSRSQDESFYVTLRDQHSDVLENGMLEFEYLHACLEAPAVPVESVQERVERFLCSYGRQVYLVPLYRALCKRDHTQTARTIFEKARVGYHPIGREAAEDVLTQFEKGPVV